MAGASAKAEANGGEGVEARARRHCLTFAAELEDEGEEDSVALGGAVGLLVTVARHLEQGVAASRFPLTWRIELAVVGDGPRVWHDDELQELLAEIRTIELELQRVPASATPTFLFGDSSFPEVYSYESEGVRGFARERYQKVLDQLIDAVAGAQDAGESLWLERIGPAVDFWG